LILKKQMGDRVKVLVRTRPILGWEDETGWAVGEQNIHSLNTKSVRAKTSRSNLSQRHHEQQLQSYTFDFDNVIGPPMTSEKIYTQHIRPTLQVAISQCLHYSVIAYGATGSGKTYTMLGE
jgi:DNA replication protein DnaC